MAGIDRLIVLCHHRWAVPIIAELHRTSGSRFVALLHRLGVNRDSLTQTLNTLSDNRIIAKNPGYGHPLRPEYILTARGKGLGLSCLRLITLLEKNTLTDMALRKWSLPTLAAVTATDGHFSQMREYLPGITPRALTLALKDLRSAGLIDRKVADTYPPSSRYAPTALGRRIQIPIEALIAA